MFMWLWSQKFPLHGCHLKNVNRQQELKFQISSQYDF